MTTVSFVGQGSRMPKAICTKATAHLTGTGGSVRRASMILLKSLAGCDSVQIDSQTLHSPTRQPSIIL